MKFDNVPWDKTRLWLCLLLLKLYCLPVLCHGTADDSTKVIRVEFEILGTVLPPSEYDFSDLYLSLTDTTSVLITEPPFKGLYHKQKVSLPNPRSGQLRYSPDSLQQFDYVEFHATTCSSRGLPVIIISAQELERVSVVKISFTCYRKKMYYSQVLIYDPNGKVIARSGKQHEWMKFWKKQNKKIAQLLKACP